MELNESAAVKYKALFRSYYNSNFVMIMIGIANNAHTIMTNHIKITSNFHYKVLLDYGLKYN